MAGNTSTKKEFGHMKDAPVGHTGPSRTATSPNKGSKYAGEISGQPTGKFAKPMNEDTAAIKGLHGLHNDIGESSGFITDGYVDKQGTPYGEAAKFNFLPPGMDISNQENAEINQMPMRILVAESYPGDGWMPTPRDIPE